MTSPPPLSANAGLPAPPFSYSMGKWVEEAGSPAQTEGGREMTPPPDLPIVSYVTNTTILC